jgi:hypothetical protein
MPSDNLLQAIEAFLLRTGLSATRFGALAAGDTKFVSSLRKGRRVREKTDDAIRGFMRKWGCQ